MLDDLKTWQAQRLGELQGADSWLGLCGLFWLEPGVNSVGSAPGARVEMPSGPSHLGDIEWDEAGLRWLPQGGAVVELQSDLAGQPTVIEYANLAFFIVDRAGKLAVRLRDRAWAASRPFAGLSYFDFDPAWQIEAQWLPLIPPIAMEVPNVSGELKMVEVSHRAVFAVNGQSVSLLPMAVGPQEVFFVFRDHSSGRQTYGAGRFLEAVPAVGGGITLDFNRAYNPPCAFTPFATCPLPPPENWLPFAVLAGEMKPPTTPH